ncbi:MAG TPA: hypothetical protein VJY86_01170 [Bacilli bacterium]|nr:hypothetical protein [Bacilli bacterium]
MKIDELIKNCKLYNTNDLIIKNLTRDLEWKSDWSETSPAILRLKQEIENAETIKEEVKSKLITIGVTF